MSSSLIRRGLRRALPKRDQWHSLQEYAVGEKNQQQFQQLRMRDATVSSLVSGQEAPQKTIDWSAWEARISNKEVFQCLKDFHTQQSALLDSVIAEDHIGAAKGQKAGWELFDAAVQSCEASIQKSEQIVKNGSRALWISFHNPPISLVSQSEWLDSDQYWQAFVEKHQYYHNHINSLVEDPESKEYDAKVKADMRRNWGEFDGKGTNRQNNKLLYQRPSYEYYDYLRAPLIEHMIFFLTKTGGDARFFPQTMPVQWYADIYDIKFKVYNVLQRRARAVQESTTAREHHTDFHPHDLDHDGEAYYTKLIARESATTELMTARLMGNFILFSDDYVPVQTGMAFYKAMQADGGRGTFYSLGADVHCLFYKPAGDALAMPGPMDCFHSLADHAAMTGRRFQVGYAAACEGFCTVLESRKEGLGGSWLTAPGESTREAFMRRLKKADPASEIFQAYASEHAERWEGAKALTMDQAMAEMPEVERKYKLECAEYDSIRYGMSEEFVVEAKQETEKLAKLAEVDKLQSQLDSDSLVAIEGGNKVTKAEDLMESVHAFDNQRDKAVEVVMAVRLPALEKRK